MLLRWIALVFALLFSGEGLLSAEAATPIRAGGDYDFPPFAYLDEDGNPAGFEIDVLRAVARAAGIPIEMNLSSWAQVREKFDLGELDLITGMTRTEERAETIAFSAPIHYIRLSVFAKEGFAFGKIADLTGQRVAVQAGDWAEEELRRHDVGVQYIYCDTPLDCLFAVAVGDADVAVVSRAQGLYYLGEKELAGLKDYGGVFSARPYCFAVQPDNPALLAALNDGLRQIRDDGTFDAIRDKWFGVAKPENTPLFFEQFLPWAILLLAAIGVFVVVWVGAMRRSVREKTRELQEANQALEKRIKERACQLLEASEKLRDGELVTLREEGQLALLTMVAGIAHEINTPLGNAKVSLSYLEEALRHLEISALDGSLTAEQTKSIDMLREGTDLTGVNLQRVADMVQRLRELDGQKYAAGSTDFAVADFLAEVSPPFKARLQIRGHSYEWQAEPELWLKANPLVLREVLAQLVDNAVLHGFVTGAQGWVHVTATRSAAAIIIDVANSGASIPEEDLPRIFEPFFTTGVRESSKGLGLSVVKNLVENVLGGNIVCENTADGVKFIIRIPGKERSDGTIKQNPFEQ